ncbi:MAG TPA: GAF domain-containing SpoIIE family protein phosphatase [Gaiellaceae bacterium]
MAAQSPQREARARSTGLDSLAESALGLALASSLPEAMQTLVDALARAAGADAVVARVTDGRRRRLDAAAVAAASPAIAAELEGSRVALELMPEAEESDPDRLPEAVRRAAARVDARFVVMLPVHVDGRLGGSLEIMRSGTPFDEDERRMARLAAGQAALAIRAFGEPGRPEGPDAEVVLDVAGDALAAGADESRTPEHVVRLAVEATGAAASLLWWRRGDVLELVATYGLELGGDSLAKTSSVLERALDGRRAVALDNLEGAAPGEPAVSATLQLGQPPAGALQLLFEDDPTAVGLAALSTFGVRAATALRLGQTARAVTLELERTRALLGVVGQAISQLSLSHTLETAVERVSQLFGVDRLAVYLLGEAGVLDAAAVVGLAGPHVRVAERLLELMLGRFRSRGLLHVHDVAKDARLGDAAEAAAEAGIAAAIALPLRAHEDVVGLLCLFPHADRVLTEDESTLLLALAGQLAVAVQNAQLHEHAKRLGEERVRALEAERAASKRSAALYEISRSFAQSLSLDATLDAVAKTAAETLDVDIALIRMPDERREVLVPRALHVVDARLDDAVRTMLLKPQPFGARSIQRLFRLRESFALSVEGMDEIGPPATALVPFLERGWTGAAVPIATTAEVIASLSIVSTRPDVPVTDETIEQAAAIGGQAALAIDNARLYQQQKRFADTMQHSLLPRSLPELAGFELGVAYESSARVEVGGDLYDFLELGDGRLAVTLGDVTGHGIEAAADMAMAKFVFRSLAREHPEPGEFLRFANDVIVGEIAPGKFITMVYLVIDASGHLTVAGGGHPSPRLIGADGTVTGLETRGLVLGIEPGQQYEEVRARVEAGGAVVLCTDGVLEARRSGELYGFERLDSVLAARRDLSAPALAAQVLEDCRAYAQGELDDDCALVVLKRTG